MKDPSSKWLLRDLYARYSLWAPEAGITWVIQRNKLKSALEHLGFPETHMREGTGVLGLAP